MKTPHTLTVQLPSLVGRVGLHDLGVDQRVLLEEVVQHAGSARPAVARARLHVGVRRSAPTYMDTAAVVTENSMRAC